MGQQRSDSGGADSIPRLVRTAFLHAKEGREGKAREFWETAIKRGYDPRPFQRLSFASAIREGKGAEAS